MDNDSLFAILSDYLSVEGNCAYLHFVDGSEILIYAVPFFHKNYIEIKNKYVVNAKDVNETVCVPYDSIIYVTLSNFENLKIISEQYQNVSDNDRSMFK